MKSIFTLLVGLLSLQANSQIITTVLDQNNCSAIISDDGIHFNDKSSSSPGYEVPVGNGTHTVYAGSMWFAGTDVNGQLKSVLPHYGPGRDLWPGALTVNTATPVVPNPLGQSFWAVTKDEINNHIYNYQTPGYVIPYDIYTWPAHGDVSQGQAFNLAPFVDTDGDGVYDPAVGDYPCVKGDAAVYTILHDRGDTLASGGEPIGIELHQMFYQYDSEPGLEDVTFIDVRVINRSTQTLFNYHTSFFMDFDVGNYQDDYMGSDPTRNLMYAYNGDNFDEDNSGAIGYDSLPPAIGMVCLNGNGIDAAVMFTNGAAFPNNDPSQPSHYYNVMQGLANDGSPLLDDQGQPTSYQYYGNPNWPFDWSEVSTGTNPGDRRGVMSTAKTTPLGFMEEYEMAYAIVYAQGTDALNSVTELFALTDSVQTFYDNLIADCYGSNLGLADTETLSVSVYPNPSSGTVSVQLPEDIGVYTIELIDMSGRVVKNTVNNQGGQIIFVTNAEAGVYVLRVTSSRGDVAQRVVIE